MKINKIGKIVKENGANIAKIVLGVVIAGAGVASAIFGKDDGEKYVPGEIAESMSDDSVEEVNDEESGESDE